MMKGDKNLTPPTAPRRSSSLLPGSSSTLDTPGFKAYALVLVMWTGLVVFQRRDNVTIFQWVTPKDGGTFVFVQPSSAFGRDNDANNNNNNNSSGTGKEPPVIPSPPPHSVDLKNYT